jgi:hypothetical protein
MGHAAERAEKDCLNCGIMVQGRYCQACGQENIIPHETFWQMVTHFFYDIMHFDSNFFVTLKDLLFKPGFLSREYILGRRKKYLHPIRMYVFTSAVFFLVFYALFTVKESDIQAVKMPVSDSLSKSKTDSGEIQRIGQGGVKFSFGDAERKYSNLRNYDSVQRSLPEKERDGWFSRMIYRRYLQLNEQYQGQNARLMTALSNKFIHTVPYMLFVSLPLYTLFLKGLYRRSKEVYYADHGIFLIHLYVFTFIFLLFYFSLDKLKEGAGLDWLEYVKAGLILTGLFYTLKAMKNFYGQGWGKTIVKFILFNLLCMVALLIIFGFFMFFSFYQV